MKRWTCPKCHDTVLAPERPRADDVRAICLPCSGESKNHMLVRRFCPALVHARNVRQEAQRAAEKQARRTAREAVLKEWTVGGVDVRSVVKACWRALLPALHERESEKLLRAGNDPALAMSPANFDVPIIEMTIRGRTSHWAWDESTAVSAMRYSSHRIRFRLSKTDDAAIVWAVVLHQLAHVGAPITSKVSAGAAEIRRVMSAGAIKLWEVGLPSDQEPVSFLVRALRRPEVLKGTRGGQEG